MSNDLSKKGGALCVGSIDYIGYSSETNLSSVAKSAVFPAGLEYLAELGYFNSLQVVFHVHGLKRPQYVIFSTWNANCTRETLPKTCILPPEIFTWGPPFETRLG